MQPTTISRIAATCGWISIATGLIAAGLWLMSARAPLPRAPGAVLDGTRPDDPFNVALAYSARLNAYAAAFTAASMFLSAAERLINRMQLTP